MVSLLPVKRVFLAIVLLGCLLQGCKNDLELNAPYKDIPIVYAVLNPSDSLQIIRINKAFLGEADANVMAKVADSVNYQPNEIEVKLLHSSGNTPIVFTESVITTEAGAFSTTQRIYVAVTKVGSATELKTSGIYTLQIKNTRSGAVFTAKAAPLSAPPVSGYAPFIPPYYPVDKSKYDPYNNGGTVYIDYSKMAQNYPIRYATNEGKIYNLTLRFHFYEVPEGTKDTAWRSVDLVYNNQTNAANSTLLSVTAKGSDIMAGLGLALNKLSIEPKGYIRRMYKVQYIVMASTQEYLDYLEYSKSGFSISSEKPLYSNFDSKAAYGIFTFRNTLTVDKEMAYPYVDVFAEDANTCKYWFSKATSGPTGCK